MDFNDSITLSQLTAKIHSVLDEKFSQSYMVVAEIQSIMQNRSGHAYLELIEKSPNSDKIVCQIKATIWAGQFRMIKPYFESVTGRLLQSGIKILAKVRVNFHELYGLSLNILDILPEYTVGELALQRQQTIQQLKDDGLFDMNRQLCPPLLIQRIAVVSSSGAAGYGDFVNQLSNNSFGYKFYPVLFEAVMQGNTAEESIIQQLERISKFQDKFDCIVIIRGGGSKTDLGCFDSYNLSRYLLWQVSLPLITGIGHDRDESVLDLVAWKHLKTPTAVAQFLIDNAMNCDSALNDSVSAIQNNISSVLDFHQKRNHDIVLNFKNILNNFYSSKLNKLQFQKSNIVNNFKIANQQLQSSENQLFVNIVNLFKTRTLEKSHNLDEIKTIIDLKNPMNILKKGYTFTVVNNKTAYSVKDVFEGQQITTYFYDGQVVSTINRITK